MKQVRCVPTRSLAATAPVPATLARALVSATLAATLVLATVATAHAGDHRLMPAGVPDVYTQECASCHIAYPPSLLPASSWQRIMNTLEEHYGTDTSLDPATARPIGDWLRVHAGTYKRVREAPPQDRITRSAWFERKHRKIDTSTWKLASVKSASNCAACHVDAEQGRFDDDDLRMPQGLDARHRRPWND